MPAHSGSEDRAARIDERAGQWFDAVPAGTFGVPVLQLCHRDSADGVLSSVVDEEEELVGRIDLVREKIGVAEIAAITSNQDVGAACDSGGMDVPVIRIRAVELDGTVEVSNDLIEVLDEIVVQTTGYISVEFGLQTPTSSNRFSDDINR